MISSLALVLPIFAARLATALDHRVVVGGPGLLAYTPPTVDAAVGDTITFELSVVHPYYSNATHRSIVPQSRKEPHRHTGRVRLTVFPPPLRLRLWIVSPPRGSGSFAPRSRI